MAETAEQYQQRTLRQAQHNDRFMQAAGGISNQKKLDEAARDDQTAQAKASESDPVKARQKGWRQMVNAARNLSAENLKEKAKEAVTAPAKLATSRGLQWTWYTLIPSWGLTLIYINIHVFLKMVVGENFFCKLGEEWIPRQAQTVSGEAGKTAGRMIGIIEVMVLLALDLLVLFIILGALGIIVLIVNFLGISWWEKLKTFWDAIWNLGWIKYIKPIIDLF